jgi:hypothetical protein
MRTSTLKRMIRKVRMEDETVLAIQLARLAPLRQPLLVFFTICRMCIYGVIPSFRKTSCVLMHVHVLRLLSSIHFLRLLQTNNAVFHAARRSSMWACWAGAEGELGKEEEVPEGEQAAAEEEAAPGRRARKPLEPYEVPTSGAFWMHDDRMGDDEPSERRALSHYTLSCLLDGPLKGFFLLLCCSSAVCAVRCSTMFGY